MAHGFALRPHLPRSWADGRYGVHNLNAGGAPVDLALDRHGDVVDLTLTARSGEIAVRDQVGPTVRLTLAVGEEIVVETRPGAGA